MPLFVPFNQQCGNWHLYRCTCLQVLAVFFTPFSRVSAIIEMAGVKELRPHAFTCGWKRSEGGRRGEVSYIKKLFMENTRTDWKVLRMLPFFFPGIKTWQRCTRFCESHTVTCLNLQLGQMWPSVFGHSEWKHLVCFVMADEEDVCVKIWQRCDWILC